MGTDDTDHSTSPPAEQPAPADRKLKITQRRLHRVLAALSCIATAIEYDDSGTDFADAVTLVAEHVDLALVELDSVDSRALARATAEGLREAAAQCTDAQAALRERLNGAASLLEKIGRDL